ncbi:protein SPMIP2 isoform X1 [Columba livia]|uniref:protein SPMIP2 isoform X1 n=1 Tax=Columba livia TaxID=8932 RepID=UPI0031BA5B9C
MVVSRGAQVKQGLEPSRARGAQSMPSLPPRALAREALVEARVVFSGPDGIRDHRTRKPEHTHYIGATSPPIEGTSDVNYLWRPAPCLSHVSPRRSSYPGDIGWGAREFSHFTRRHLRSGAHIKRGEIRQAAEDGATHRYQSPCAVSRVYDRINYLFRFIYRARQPPPCILDQQGHNARAMLAWNLGRQEGWLHPHTNQAVTAQASQASLLPKSKGLATSKKLNKFIQEMKAGSACRTSHYQLYNHPADVDSN